MDCITAESTALINYTWWGCFIPPIVLLRYNRRSSIPIGAPPSELVLQYFIQCSRLHFYRCSSRMGAPWPWSESPEFHSRLFTSLPFGDAHHTWAAPLERHSLARICVPQFHSALLHHHHHSLCAPCTPHQAVLLSWWRTLFCPKFIILISNSILIHCELTSQFQWIRYHKSSQMTLEFNFAHAPGPNHSEMKAAPPASFHRWWIVCSCICRSSWDGRFRGWC
jgi:hypothetical protein